MAIPQPNLVAVNLSSSLTTQRSGMAGSTSILVGLPFNLKSIFIRFYF
jgi:hypothetical protein